METPQDANLEMKKIVDVKERIINDNDSGVDYLGHTLYAEALAETIANVSSPITIGVFGRWGSGKTFLIKHVCNILRRKQAQFEVDHATPSGQGCCSSKGLKIAVVVICVILLAAGIILLIPQVFTVPSALHNHTNHSSTTNSSSPTISNHTAGPPSTGITVRQTLSIVMLSLSVILAVSVFVIVYFNDYFPVMPNLSNARLLLMCALARMPVRGVDTATLRGGQPDYDLVCDDAPSDPSVIENTVEQRYLFVNFNAWACAGTDNLWAGIATALVVAAEAEFGRVTTRLTRMLQIVTVRNQTSSNERRQFFARLGDCNQAAEDILKDLGVVQSMVAYNDWKNELKGEQAEDSKNWWVVTYANSMQASVSFQYLKNLAIVVSMEDPLALNAASGENCNDSEKAPLINEGSKQGDNKTVRRNVDGSQGNEVGKKQGVNNVYENGQSVPSNLTSIRVLLSKYSKTSCNIPMFVWMVFLLFLLLIPIPLTIYAEATTAAIPAATLALAWLPGVTAGVFAVIRFIYAMVNSQNSRINSALKGTRATLQAQLGVMNQIKYEITHITQLVQCAELSHRKQYKFVIVVDDLDKISLPKVKSVLDAVSILLSDRYSPFVCLISINSRVAVESIEHAFSIGQERARVSAQKYLRKIINLPFCLPTVKEKKRYIGGLIDQADKSRNELISKPNLPPPLHKHAIDPSFNFPTLEKAFPNMPVMFMTGPHQETYVNKHHYGALGERAQTTDVERKPHTSSAPSQYEPITISREKVIKFEKTEKKLPRRDLESQLTPLKEEAGHPSHLKDKEFLFLCRKFFFKNDLIQESLEGNPRMIKRIFNIVTLTATIMNRYHKMVCKEIYIKKLSQKDGSTSEATNEDVVDIRDAKVANDLVIWTILTEQWPYKMSYIIQVIQDSDDKVDVDLVGKKIADDMPLMSIYRDIMIPEFDLAKNQAMTNMDADANLFENCLKQLNFHKSQAKLFSRYSVNLDHGIRVPIAHQRELVAIAKHQAAVAAATSSTQSSQPSTLSTPSASG